MDVFTRTYRMTNGPAVPVSTTVSTVDELLARGDALDIPLPFNRFHDEALIEFAEDALAVSYYTDWRATGQPDILFDQCAGFNVPLFLGGEDEVTNLELTDIDVYWFTRS